MLSGHGRQPVSRIWSLGGTGEGKTSESLTVQATAPEGLTSRVSNPDCSSTATAAGRARASNTDCYPTSPAEAFSPALHSVRFKRLRSPHIPSVRNGPRQLLRVILSHPVCPGPTTLPAAAQTRTFTPLDLGAWYFLRLKYL